MDDYRDNHASESNTALLYYALLTCNDAVNGAIVRNVAYIILLSWPPWRAGDIDVDRSALDWKIGGLLNTSLTSGTPRFVIDRLRSRFAIPFIDLPIPFIDLSPISEKIWRRKIKIDWELKSFLEKECRLEYYLYFEKNLIYVCKSAPRKLYIF